MSVIEVHNLVKKYKQLTAVDGISFSVEKGEIFGILGPNGAGKTTTLEILEGLKKQSSGQCLILGHDNLKETELVKLQIGVQLQSSEYLNNVTLAELLELFASLYSRKINAKEVLAKVGLEDRADSEVKELSGGQKQRFTIATALVHKPQILFLDEPTTGLDPAARKNMWQLIKELNSEGMTIIMTTHYMEEAEYLCDRIAILDHGHILKIDQPHALIQSVLKHYTLSFFLNKDVPAESFTNIPGVIAAEKEFPQYSLKISGPEVLPLITKRIEELGVFYSFLNLSTARLEDVYLQLTGHQYQSGE